MYWSVVQWLTCLLALLYAFLCCGGVRNDVDDSYDWSVDLYDDVCWFVAVQLYEVEPDCLRRPVHLIGAAVDEHANKQGQSSTGTTLPTTHSSQQPSQHQCVSGRWTAHRTIGLRDW